METDFLVIGSGISGLSFALQATEYGKVVMITKKEAAESNTNYAQGGIAAVMGENDDFRYHIADTLKVGEGLCDRKAVELMVKAAQVKGVGPKRAERLKRSGIETVRDLAEASVEDLVKEAGFSEEFASILIIRAKAILREE